MTVRDRWFVQRKMPRQLFDWLVWNHDINIFRICGWSIGIVQYISTEIMANMQNYVQFMLIRGGHFYHYIPINALKTPMVSACLVTARKRSLWRLCFYTCLSFCPPEVWYPSMHCRSPGPHPGGGSWGVWPWGGSPGPHPEGGEVEGPGLGGLQAHT